MPVKLKIPSVIASRYELVREVWDGSMSWAYEANDLKEPGRRVFLKYYKSPTPTISWYEGYVHYLNEINNILASSAAASNCVLGTDLFVASPRPERPDYKYEYLFQAFDFIEGGYDLKHRMQDGIGYRDRVTMAMLFLNAMKSIHEAGIVHCDLKPENVQMIDLNDPSVELKWIPRLIDMDGSIMADKRAPWTQGKDKIGYVGTPGYYSPEHLRGETPQKGSDVFTIGIILGELLGGKHPFAAYLDDYKDAALNEKYEEIRLLEPLGGDAAGTREFELLVNRCLCADIHKRPTCEELHLALLKADNPPHVSDPPIAMTLKLVGDLNELAVRLPRAFGKNALRDVSSEAERFCASGEQFKLDYDRTTQEWYIVPPVNEPRNPTALNGNYVSCRTKLNEGDTICLKSRTSGKTAMELKVSLTPLYR